MVVLVLRLRDHELAALGGQIPAELEDDLVVVVLRLGEGVDGGGVGHAAATGLAQRILQDLVLGLLGGQIRPHPVQVHFRFLAHVDQAQSFIRDARDRFLAHEVGPALLPVLELLPHGVDLLAEVGLQLRYGADVQAEVRVGLDHRARDLPRGDRVGMPDLQR